MKVSIAILFISMLFLTAPLKVKAQHLVSGFFQGKGKFAVAVSTTRENFDEFYLGDKKSSITIRKGAMQECQPIIHLDLQ